MGKTITTHNGSAAHREHNIRNPKATGKMEHINKELEGQNDILYDEPPREAYRRLFGAAQAAYNQKMREQGRPGRQIQSYYGHVEKDAKKHPVYEMIVQIGDRDDTGIDAPVERECLKEFYAGWKERNPHLECIGAYIHADEDDGTLHMHVDYIPVATGYKKGMEVQNGLVKALEQQGFVKQGQKTAQILWEARENAVLEAICNSHGIEVVHPEGEKRQHLDTQTYKAEQKLSELEERVWMSEEKVAVNQELAIVYEQQADEQQEKLLEATEQVEAIKKELVDLRSEKDALRGDLELLRGEKAEMERELPALKVQISAAKSELELVKEATKEKKDEGFRQFGGNELELRLEKARRDREMQSKLRSYEKLIAQLQEFFDRNPDVAARFQQERATETQRKPKDRDR